MMTGTLRAALLLASYAVLAACGTPGAVPSPEETAVDPSQPSSPTSQPSSPSTTPPRRDVTTAVEDLAAALEVDAREVEVVSVEEVTWRDGSRGCAEPGTSYTQALIDGSRITLRAGGRTYEYHSGGSRPPARCDKPTQ